ncbi:hypothetical protein [Aeromonas allosaccharophila]|uniref:Flagellar protein FliT n=1 Tax=Aeromonas allosaccharophila TaxID=656 RepID=A0A7T2UP96_9GAMM|nr:hypothetical protein [Aeromonas allosaccharophila]QPR56315.1 hypothetical protein I6G90_07930 [Aeromonas allosaccharophila]
MTTKQADDLNDFSDRIASAFCNHKLDLAHELVDLRLQWLQDNCIAESYSADFVAAAMRALEQDQKICVLIEEQKKQIEIKLRDFMAAEKVSQLYKTYSK